MLPPLFRDHLLNRLPRHPHREQPAAVISQQMEQHSVRAAGAAWCDAEKRQAAQGCQPETDGWVQPFGVSSGR